MVPDFSRTRKSRLLLLLLSGVLSAGCAARKPKDAIPVVGPPPPRYSLDSDAPSSQPVVGLDPEANRPAGDFINVSLNEPADQLFTDTRTVAYVNGEPILASEVLEPYAEKLAELRQQVPPEQFEQLRLQLIERDLPIQIDNRLLIQGFKSSLKKPQQDMLDEAVRNMFNKEVEKLKAQFGVNHDYELDVELHKKNSSLASLERAFGNRVMAAEFLRSKAGSIREPSRRELLEAYEQRKQEEYYRPARVRWQQILISYGANGGKQGAIEKLTKAAQELRNGTDFSEVAKTYSDGPGAAQGGYWDWMQRGSLSDQAVEEELFSMPVGRISDVLVGESSFQLVRVLERDDEQYIPFEKVQDALKDELKEEWRKAATERVMQELRANAVIQTMFDEPELTETEATPPAEITPIGFEEPDTSPNAKQEPQANPFAEREAAEPETNPFANPEMEPNPFAGGEPSASGESDEPIAKENPFGAQDNPFAEGPGEKKGSQNSPFESFTETSPFE